MSTIAERYQKLYSGVVSDAMEFDCGLRLAGLGQDTRRASGPRKPIAGPGFVCNGTRARHGVSDEEDAIRLEMLDAMNDGCVQVVFGNDDDQPFAIFGDISAKLAKASGAVGAVVAGYTRDIDAINAMEFPLYCRGTHPGDAYGKWYISGFKQTTDWIFADGDSVLVIPAGREEEVLELAEKRAASEAEIRLAIDRGDKPVDIYERFGRW